MKRIIVLSTVALTAALLSGCVGQAVPKLQLGVNMKTGTVTLANPKDTTIKNYRTEIGSNGTVIVSFDSLTTVMNPDVITTTGDAQAKMIQATGQAITTALDSAGTAAGKAAGAIIK